MYSEDQNHRTENDRQQGKTPEDPANEWKIPMLQVNWIHGFSRAHGTSIF